MYTLIVNMEGSEKAGSYLNALTAGITPGAIRAAISRPVLAATKQHLYGLANTRHRPGVALNFWKDAGDATTVSRGNEGVVIRIDKAGAAQRYYGGTIKAINYTHLWIPVAPESEGKSASEFQGLVPIISPLTNRGVGILHEKGGNLMDEPVLFALVPEVTQDPDPSVLPSDDQYADAVAAGIDNLVSRYGSQETSP